MGKCRGKKRFRFAFGLSACGLFALAACGLSACGHVTVEKLYDETGIKSEKINIWKGMFDWKNDLATRQTEGATEFTYGSQDVSGAEKVAMMQVPADLLIRLIAAYAAMQGVPMAVPQVQPTATAQPSYLITPQQPAQPTAPARMQVIPPAPVEK